MNYATCLISAIFAGSLAQAALADGPAPAPVAPMPAVAPADTDWTGPYVGVYVGAGNLDDTFQEDTHTDYGIRLGYLHDFGKVVVGGELSYEGFDFGQGGAFQGLEPNSVMRGKLRVGYDAGRVLPYVFGSYGTMKINDPQYDDTVTGGGLGLDYQINDRLRAGGEFIWEQSDDDYGGCGCTVTKSAVSFHLDYTF